MSKYGSAKYGEGVYGVSTLYISPDLGWASLDAMLDPSQNPAAVEIQDTEMSATSSMFTGYIGPNYRIIDLLSGPLKELSVSAMWKLTAHGMKYYYRVGPTGTIGTFVLRREAG